MPSCCAACAKGAGQHGVRCNRTACADRLEERAKALQEMRDEAAGLRQVLQKAGGAVVSLKPVWELCSTAHDHYMRAMQKQRAADALGTDEGAAEAREARRKDAVAEGTAGGEALQKAYDSLPEEVVDRFPSQCEAFRMVPAAALGHLDSLEGVQKFVTLAFEKKKMINDIEAALRQEASTARERLKPMDEAFAKEEKREAHAREAADEAAAGRAILTRAFGALITPAMPVRYAEGVSPLLDVPFPSELRDMVALTYAKERTCKELEPKVRHDCDVAKGRLAPIEAAIRLYEACEAKLERAVGEGDKGADLLSQAWSAMPPRLPERYPLCAGFVGVTIALLAEAPEPERPTIYTGGCKLAACKAELSREIEAGARADLDAAKAALATLSAAIKAEEKRLARAREASEEGDKGAQLLMRALAAVPPAVARRYPTEAAPLASVQVPLFSQANLMARIVEFAGGSGSLPAAAPSAAAGEVVGAPSAHPPAADAGGLLTEWASGEWLRQMAALIQHCEGLILRQQAVAKELESTLRRDCVSELTRCRAHMPIAPPLHGCTSLHASCSRVRARCCSLRVPRSSPSRRPIGHRSAQRASSPRRKQPFRTRRVGSGRSCELRPGRCPHRSTLSERPRWGSP